MINLLKGTETFPIPILYLIIKIAPQRSCCAPPTVASPVGAYLPPYFLKYKLVILRIMTKHAEVISLCLIKKIVLVVCFYSIGFIAEGGFSQ